MKLRRGKMHSLAGWIRSSAAAAKDESDKDGVLKMDSFPRDAGADFSGGADTGVKQRVNASSCENKELKGNESTNKGRRRQSYHVTGIDESSAAEEEDDACAEVTGELSNKKLDCNAGDGPRSDIGSQRGNEVQGDVEDSSDKVSGGAVAQGHVRQSNDRAKNITVPVQSVGCPTSSQYAGHNIYYKPAVRRNEQFPRA